MGFTSKIERPRGTTLEFGHQMLPPYDGTEEVECSIKHATSGSKAPADGEPVVLQVAPTFEGGTWVATVSAVVCDELDSGDYITDFKITYADGTVEQTPPLLIKLQGRVTQ